MAPERTASHTPAYSPHLLNPVIRSPISTRPALFPNSTDVPLLWRAYCITKPSHLTVDSRELPIPRNTRPGSFSITSKLRTTSQAAISQHLTETHDYGGIIYAGPTYRHSPSTPLPERPSNPSLYPPSTRPAYAPKEPVGHQTATSGSRPSPHLLQGPSHLGEVQARQPPPTVISETAAGCNGLSQCSHNRRDDPLHSSLACTSTSNLYLTGPGVPGPQTLSPSILSSHTDALPCLGADIRNQSSTVTPGNSYCTTYHRTPSGITSVASRSHGLEAFRINLPTGMRTPHLFSIHSNYKHRFQSFQEQQMYNLVYFVVHSPYPLCIDSQCLWSWRTADNTEINEVHPIYQHDYIDTTNTHVYRFRPVIFFLLDEEKQGPVTLTFHYYKNQYERCPAIIHFQLQ
ncbi:hypothetical protein CC2G_001988 [Coprinopsis cinerea AmutBmut pab1-1]|nr:hypothetical protein CC2G_001988 [Coprinopsis cinerea AmutBmut pab1-1]